MRTLLCRAVLIKTFGRGSDRPLRTAVTRLAGLAAGAVALDLLFAWSVRTMPLAPPARPALLFFSCLFAVQLVIATTLLASPGVVTSQNDNLARWLQSLPLASMQRAGLLLLPGFMLAGLALLLAAGPLAVIMLRLGLAPALLAGAVLVGSFTALGLAYGLPGALGWRLLATGAVLGAEYKLLGPLTSGGSIVALVAYSLLIISLLALFGRSLVRHGQHPPKAAGGSAVRTAWLPPTYWFAKKLLRSKATLASLAVALLLSIGLAVFSRRQALADSSLLAMFGALLVGSFTADVRTLARRSNPAEITGLRGTLRFMGGQIAVAGYAGLVIVLPTAWALHGDITGAFITQIGLGMAAGLLAGALVVPEPRDVTSQFLAVILVLALLAGLPQLPGIGQLWASSAAWLQTGLMLLFVAIACTAEYTRNNYIWRNPKHAQQH